MSVEIFPDDLVQTLSFLGRLQLLKFMFINRLFFVLIEEYFSTRPFLNAILRIWSEPQDDQEADGDEVKHHIYLGIGLLEDKNAFLLEGEKKKHRLLERKITRKWQWWLKADYRELDACDLDALQGCRKIVQLFQDGDHLKCHSWHNDEEEQCFVHQLHSDEKNSDTVELSTHLDRVQTKQWQRRMREHLIANKFLPSRQCPRCARIKIGEGNKEDEELHQQFLDTYLNLASYVRLLSIEIAVPHWSHHTYEPTNNSNHSCTSSSSYAKWILGIRNIRLNVMPPKILHIKYDEHSPAYAVLAADNERLCDFIYTNGHKCTIEIEMTSPFLEKNHDIIRMKIANMHDEYDWEFRYSFYNRATKEYWRLHWILLDYNLCHVKINRYHEESDAQLHSQLNYEIEYAIRAMLTWSSLQNSIHSELCNDYFERIGPFLTWQNVLRTIDTPAEINALVSEHSLNSWLLERSNM